MPQETILIVEDDAHISKLVKYNLEKAGFRCIVTVTGESALEILDKQAVDFIILDIMLPKMDGFETCKWIRQEPKSSSIPLIMLTAKGEEVDRIVGLELGADDYIVKPFSPRELVLRVKTILRRGKSKDTPKDLLRAGPVSIDIPRHRVRVQDREVDLTAKEFDLLVTLLSRRGRVQTRDQLLSDVWNIDADVNTRTVDTHIKCLRQKLGRCGKMIETVRGLGYRINDEE